MPSVVKPDLIYAALPFTQQIYIMNFYFDAAKIIDRLDAKRGSVKSLMNTLPEKSRKRTAALVIETLKCR